MQKFLSRSLVIVAYLSLSMAAANAAQAAPDTPPAPAGNVQIKAAPTYEPTNLDRQEQLGAYKLESGEVVRITESGLHFYSETNNRTPVEIFPRAPGVFVTATGVTLTVRDNGDTLVVRQPERQLASSR